MSNENDIIPVMVRFSNWRRGFVERQQSKGYKMRKINILEVYTFTFVPCAITSTLLAPLNRLKIILQVKDGYMYNNKPQLRGFGLVKNTISEQGVLSLFKGNLAYTMKIFAQITSKTLFIDRIKNKVIESKIFIDMFKYRILGANIFLDFISAFSATMITLLMTHPFDMAYTRIAGQNKHSNKFEYNKIKDCFHYIEPSQETIETNRTKINIGRYYHGYWINFINAIAYSTLTLVGFQILFRLKKEENTSILNMSTFTFAGLIGLVAGTITYPIDTIKRQIFVNGAKGFQFKYTDSKELTTLLNFSKYPKLYAGFSFFFIRSLPFSYIQYYIFHTLTNFLIDSKQNK
jgi:hypothetical protein